MTAPTTRRPELVISLAEAQHRLDFDELTDAEARAVILIASNHAIDLIDGQLIDTASDHVFQGIQVEKVISVTQEPAMVAIIVSETSTKNGEPHRYLVFIDSTHVLMSTLGYTEVEKTCGGNVIQASSPRTGRQAFPMAGTEQLLVHHTTTIVWSASDTTEQA